MAESPSGKATVCKTVIRGFDSRLRLHQIFLILKGLRQLLLLSQSTHFIAFFAVKTVTISLHFLRVIHPTYKGRFNF